MKLFKVLARRNACVRERRIKVAPLVEAYFAWGREQLSSETLLPKGKTLDGLNYCLNQEQYLRKFLNDGNVPIDNSAALFGGYFYSHLLSRSA